VSPECEEAFALAKAGNGLKRYPGTHLWKAREGEHLTLVATSTVKTLTLYGVLRYDSERRPREALLTGVDPP